MARHAPPVNIGTALQDEATRRGLSHAEAGELLDISQASFSRWVNGDNVPAPRYWQAIARFLRIPKEQVSTLCAQERAGRGNRGVRRVATDMTELRREVDKLRRDQAELHRLVLRLVEQNERALR